MTNIACIMRSAMEKTPGILNRKYGTILWVLFGLFCFRVFAQILVYFIHLPFLPPFEKWHSNTLPYPVLLCFQGLIIIIFTRNCLRVQRDTLKANIKTGKFLKVFGGIYFLSMIIRYIITMVLHPELRWLGHAIPVFFHMVLASFLITLGYYHVNRSGNQHIS